MAHFAQLNNNDVVQIVVVSNDDMLDADGNEIEALGIVVCEQVTGSGPWVQTSYHGNFRRRYAAIGMTYSTEHDAFILPQPYPSWTLDLTDSSDWVAPVPRPTDKEFWYEWDEANLTWVAHPIDPKNNIL